MSTEPGLTREALHDRRDTFLSDSFMTPTYTLGFVAAWFVFGMARMVFTSKLVEHRIDNPDPGQAMAVNSDAASERLNAANYDLLGRRLLPWYRAINTTYWIVAAGGCSWAVFHG